MIIKLVKLITVTSISMAIPACDNLRDARPNEVKACEQFLIAKLKSPSSYNFLKHTMFDNDLTTEAFLKERFPNLKTPWKKYQEERSETFQDIIDAMATGATNPVKRLVSVEYEASNTFGAQIKGTEYCSFLSRDGQPLEIHETSINVWVSQIPFGKTTCCIRPNEKVE